MKIDTWNVSNLRKRNSYRILAEKRLGKRQHGRITSRWILGWEVDRKQDRGQWRALILAVLKFWILQQHCWLITYLFIYLCLFVCLIINLVCSIVNSSEHGTSSIHRLKPILERETYAYSKSIWFTMQIKGSMFTLLLRYGLMKMRSSFCKILINILYSSLQPI